MAWDLPVPDLTIARDSSLVVWVIEHQPHKTVDSGARKPDLWPFVSKLSSARRPAHHCPVLPCRCATPSGIAVHPSSQGFRLRLTVSERCDCANAARAPMGPGQYAPALASIAHDRIRRPKQWVSGGVDRLARLVLAFRALQHGQHRLAKGFGPAQLGIVRLATKYPRDELPGRGRIDGPIGDEQSSTARVEERATEARQCFRAGTRTCRRVAG